MEESKFWSSLAPAGVWAVCFRRLTANNMETKTVSAGIRKQEKTGFDLVYRVTNGVYGTKNKLGDETEHFSYIA